MEKQKRIRIKKDVFKNTEFGKLYRMRDGSKAVFLMHKYMSNDCVVLIEYGFGFYLKNPYEEYCDWKWSSEDPNEIIIT